MSLCGYVVIVYMALIRILYMIGNLIWSQPRTESSQEETESLEPWSRIFDEAEKRHEVQLNALINEYEGNGDSENVARIKTENALVPVYRKVLRKVLLRNLQWMHAIKKRPHLHKSDGNPKRA